MENPSKEHPHDANNNMNHRHIDSIIHHTKEISSLLGNEDIPDWVESKLAVSAKELSDAYHFLESEKKQAVMEKSGDKKKKKPFKGYNKKKHSKEGGLNDKAREKYNRETGSNLKRPVTSDNPKGEAKSRKKSFCARMSGVKGPTSEGGELTPKGAALKRWKCNKSMSEFAKSFLQKNKDRCWDGYKPTPGKKPYTKGSCIKKSDKPGKEEYYKNIEENAPTLDYGNINRINTQENTNTIDYGKFKKPVERFFNRSKATGATKPKPGSEQSAKTAMDAIKDRQAAKVTDDFGMEISSDEELVADMKGIKLGKFQKTIDSFKTPKLEKDVIDFKSRKKVGEAGQDVAPKTRDEKLKDALGKYGSHKGVQHQDKTFDDPGIADISDDSPDLKKACRNRQATFLKNYKKSLKPHTRD